MYIAVRFKALLLGAAILPTVLWAKPGDPLTFKAIDQRTYVQLSVPPQLDPKPVFEYRSGESGEWRPYPPAGVLYVNAGETVSIRAATNGVQSLVGDFFKYGDVYSPSRHCSFGTGDGRMEVSGDVTTLLCRQGVDEVPGWAFYLLFADHCKTIVSAPELPARKVGKCCCRDMFKGCTALTNAPVLAATELDEGCYWSMFWGCSALTAAPELPARELAADCYYMMFHGCSALETPPALPAAKLADDCYHYMFSGCTSLKSAPALPATTLAESCYQCMFYGCAALTVAPSLPATEMKESCYSCMFDGCAALTVAPSLPATEMKKSCYGGMFSGCTSLKSAPALPATELAEGCYNAMFEGCQALAEAPVLSAKTMAKSCYSYMFSDCSGLLEAPALPAKNLHVSCYLYMFQNCTSLTHAPELPSDRVLWSSYEGMFSGCTGLTEAPLLPSPDLFNAESCYAAMFRGCTSLTNVTLMAKNEKPAFWSDYFANWLSGVAPHGTIRCPASLLLPENSVSGVPEGWVRETIVPPSPISGVEESYSFVAGAPIEPIVPTVAEGWAVKVTGLPAGLKYASATGVTGTPTAKPDVFAVTFTATKPGEEDAIVTTEITVRTVAVTVEVAGTGTGKVTGAGEYAAGKKVTLKATPDKNMVFSGWYDGDNLVSRLASYVLDKMPPHDVTLYARFIAVADDVAAVSFELPTELTNGEAAENVSVDVSGCTSQPTVKVTGLPTGLKFTAKDVLKKGSKTEVEHPANTIYGTPTKSGVYTVVATATTAGKKTASASQTVIVRKGGEFVAKAEVPPVDDAVPGKVTGMGVYAKDKKVTLKAAANKGYVFSGWYDGDVLLSRAASYVIDKMPEEDVSLTAAFVTATEDAASIKAAVNGMDLSLTSGQETASPLLTNVTAGVYLEWPVAASALSATTVKVSGLPSGLKFTAKDIYKKGSKTEVDVPANTIYGAPTAASKADKKTGKAKPSQVKVTVTTAGKSKQTYQVDMTVDPLPDWAVGTFAGPSYGEGGTNGVANVTVATSGKISVKQPVNGKTASFAATSFDRYDAEAGAYVATLMAKVGKEVVTNEMAVAEAEIGMGFIEADRFDAWQYNWMDDSWKAVGKSFDKREVSYEEDGVTVTLKFSAKGTAKVAGEFTDASGKVVRASGSATLLPTVGEDGGTRYIAFVYLAPKGLPPHARCVEVPAEVAE